MSNHINLNAHVYADLSELGEAILHAHLAREDHNALRYHSDTPWYRSPEQRFSEWRRDEQGRFRFQLYEFMAIFGPHMPNHATSVGLPLNDMNLVIE
jgi:hypothetical protein